MDAVQSAGLRLVHALARSAYAVQEVRAMLGLEIAPPPSPKPVHASPQPLRPPSAPSVWPQWSSERPINASTRESASGLVTVTRSAGHSYPSGVGRRGREYRAQSRSTQLEVIPYNWAMSVKERMTEIIKAQPDDSSFEEILRELAFARMVELGLEDSRAGRTVSTEELKQKAALWRG